MDKYSWLYISRMKQKLGEIREEQCLTHVKKSLHEVWSCLALFDFSKKSHLSLLPQPLQLSEKVSKIEQPCLKIFQGY